MLYLLLVFLPLLVTLAFATKIQVSKGQKTAAVATVLMELFVILDYYSLEEWALQDVVMPKWFLFVVAMLYSLIIPMFYIFICECIHGNWKTDRTAGMVMLCLLNLIPSIVLNIDDVPMASPAHYFYLTVVRGGERVVDIRTKDFVMVIQLVWLVYLHVRYFRWMLQKDYHFTINSKKFYMTLLCFVVVAILANLVPNSYWKIPIFIWGYFAFASVSFSIVNVMIVRGVMESPVQDENNEPIIESIAENSGSLGMRVVELIRTQQLYHNANLQLADVAKIVNSNRSYVSKAVNEVTGLNFNGYLNKLRTEEAMKILLEEKDIKLEEVAEKCGFTSASLFTRVFKKETGMTPSQARKELAEP